MRWGGKSALSHNSLGPLVPDRVDLSIQRAADGEAAALDDVGVDHSGLDASVAQQLIMDPEF